MQNTMTRVSSLVWLVNCVACTVQNACVAVIIDEKKEVWMNIVEFEASQRDSEEAKLLRAVVYSSHWKLWLESSRVIEGSD